MSMQRVIEFETSSDEGAARVVEALAVAFEALATEQPGGVSLVYWRVAGSRRFLGLIELAHEGVNPLMEMGATRDLTAVVGECVTGGYPRPDTVELVGSFGFTS